jgi:hypothetical protein
MNVKRCSLCVEFTVVEFETIVNPLLSKSLQCNDCYYAGCYVIITDKMHTFYINLVKSSRFFTYPPGLTFKTSTWCSLCVECFVRISEQTAAFALYVVKLLVFMVFITVVQSVYSAVRTNSLYKADYVSSLEVPCFNSIILSLLNGFCWFLLHRYITMRGSKNKVCGMFFKKSHTENR